MSYTAKDIRNVCLLGHSGTGKTSLVESMLWLWRRLNLKAAKSTYWTLRVILTFPAR